MKCYCDNKCFNYYNVSTNEMVYKCNTIELNVISKSNQDWSSIKFERNKQNKCNFKHIISYGKIKPRKHLRHGHWFKKPTKVNEKKTENNNKNKILELKDLFYLWDKNIIDHTYYNAIRIRSITNYLGWNSDHFNIIKGKNGYGQRIYHFDWTSFMNFVGKCLHITLVISKHIGFRPIKPIKIIKTKLKISKVTDLYRNTPLRYTPSISNEQLEHIKNLRHRMKRKALQNHS